MPLERFVDTITEHISLRIKKDPIAPRVDYFSSHAFDSFHYVPLAAAYIERFGLPILAPMEEKFTIEPFFLLMIL